MIKFHLIIIFAHITVHPFIVENNLNNAHNFYNRIYSIFSSLSGWLIKIAFLWLHSNYANESHIISNEIKWKKFLLLSPHFITIWCDYVYKLFNLIPPLRSFHTLITMWWVYDLIFIGVKNQFLIIKSYFNKYYNFTRWHINYNF